MSRTEFWEMLINSVHNESMNQRTSHRWIVQGIYFGKSSFELKLESYMDWIHITGWVRSHRRKTDSEEGTEQWNCFLCFLRTEERWVSKSIALSEAEVQYKGQMIKPCVPMMDLDYRNSFRDFVWQNRLNLYCPIWRCWWPGLDERFGAIVLDLRNIHKL